MKKILMLIMILSLAIVMSASAQSAYYGIKVIEGTSGQLGPGPQHGSLADLEQGFKTFKNPIVSNANVSININYVNINDPTDKYNSANIPIITFNQQGEFFLYEDIEPTKIIQKDEKQYFKAGINIFAYAPNYRSASGFQAAPLTYNSSNPLTISLDPQQSAIGRVAYLSKLQFKMRTKLAVKSYKKTLNPFSPNSPKEVPKEMPIQGQ